MPLPVRSGVLPAIALGGSASSSRTRKLVPTAFPLLLPPAAPSARTAKARPWHATVMVADLAGLSFAYGAYLVVVAGTPL